MFKNKEKIKRYVMATVSFCFMISIAAYINYKYNPEREKDLGQTVYVSTNTDETYVEETIEVEDTEEVSTTNDSTIDSFREDRDNMYVELANNYSQIIDNENTSNDMVALYQEKLSSLVEEKNQILIVENIIKSKGVDDVVIVLTNSQKANVILRCDTLDETLVAQIMQAIVDGLGIDASNITIENITL